MFLLLLHLITEEGVNEGSFMLPDDTSIAALIPRTPPKFLAFSTVKQWNRRPYYKQWICFKHFYMTVIETFGQENAKTSKIANFGIVSIPSECWKLHKITQLFVSRILPFKSKRVCSHSLLVYDRQQLIDIYHIMPKPLGVSANLRNFEFYSPPMQSHSLDYLRERALGVPRKRRRRRRGKRSGVAVRLKSTWASGSTIAPLLDTRSKAACRLHISWGSARWFVDLLGHSGFAYQDYLLEFPKASSQESESLQVALTSQSI
ncbi:hypothetical protein ROHU_008790 [Labeo rohita]|uniref:Uncharacterized protein n=1 Tax=Labeo rohita TaxID=84645 RepID=A0A498ME46_LABRO|nr:hypothetical protein ROHU_008790 [Labeo rohita]